MEVRAARAIGASPERIFDYLESFERHLELMRGRAELESVGKTGSRVRLRGPLGVGRTVQTRLTYAEAPHSIVGTAKMGRRTRGSVRWSIQRSGRGSWVQIVARVESLGLLDRVLVELGGRRWLATSLELALDVLRDRMRDDTASALATSTEGS